MNEDSSIEFQIHYRKQFWSVKPRIRSSNSGSYYSNQVWHTDMTKLWSKPDQPFFISRESFSWCCTTWSRGQMKERYRTDNVKTQFQRNKILAFEKNSESTGFLPRELSWENEVNTRSLEQLYAVHPGQTLSVIMSLVGATAPMTEHWYHAEYVL